MVDCIATDTELEKFAPLGVIAGVATVSANDTASVKVVVLSTPPPFEVTVMGKLPAGVEAVVLMFSTVEHAGLQEVDENEAAAPVGSPETLNETA